MCNPSRREQLMWEILQLLGKFPDEVRDYILDDLEIEAKNRGFDSPDDTQSRRPDSSDSS